MDPGNVDAMMQLFQCQLPQSFAMPAAVLDIVRWLDDELEYSGDGFIHVPCVGQARRHPKGIPRALNYLLVFLGNFIEFLVFFMVFLVFQERLLTISDYLRTVSQISGLKNT